MYMKTLTQTGGAWAVCSGNICTHRQWQIQRGLHELHFSPNIFWNVQIKEEVEVGTTEDKILLW